MCLCQLCLGYVITYFTLKWSWSVVSDSFRPDGWNSPPGSSVHGILQARILGWVAISFSRGSSWPRDWTQCLRHCWQTLYCLRDHDKKCICFDRKSLEFSCSVSHVQLFATPWTAALQASLAFTVSQSLLNLICFDRKSLEFKVCLFPQNGNGSLVNEHVLAINISF